MPTTVIPEKFNRLRQRALKALYPVTQTNVSFEKAKNVFFNTKLISSEHLPPYYLLHFLFIELFGFKKIGHGEKVSWIIPLETAGKVFTIEHRKFGVGVFSNDIFAQEQIIDLQERIRTAVGMSHKFFDWIASQAIDSSNVNVYNKSLLLCSRYMYLRQIYFASKSIDNNKISIEEIKQHSYKMYWHGQNIPEWHAIAAIDSFFSWTEHVFVLIAILNGKILTANEVSRSALSSWPEKFKAIFDLADPEVQKHYELLLAMRLEIRNYQAHGAFGKEGEAFQFHSRAGAVAALLPHHGKHRKFTIKTRLGVERYEAEKALKAIENFIIFLWSEPRQPALTYLESDLPLILTLANDGTYAKAMQSQLDMKELVEHLSNEFDRAANMDF